MTVGDHSSAARERVLHQAEALFSERGYDSVTLRDIAEALGMRQASLYHHAPGGKEQLYVEVTERGLQRHRRGLVEALGTTGDLRQQLRAAARWLLSQPPINLSRFVRSDLPAITQAHADRLFGAAYQALFAPVEGAVRVASDRGEIRRHDLSMIAGTFLTLIEGVWDAGGGRALDRPREALADELVDILLDGLRPRVGEGAG